jgi:hypothetical protein
VWEDESMTWRSWLPGLGSVLVIVGIRIVAGQVVNPPESWWVDALWTGGAAALISAGVSLIAETAPFSERSWGCGHEVRWRSKKGV